LHLCFFSSDVVGGLYTVFLTDFGQYALASSLANLVAARHGHTQKLFRRGIEFVDVVILNFNRWAGIPLFAIILDRHVDLDVLSLAFYGCIFLIIRVVVEGVNDDGEDEIHGEEGAEKDDEHEENHRNYAVPCVLVIVHQVDPTFEGQDLKDSKQRLANVIKSWYSIHDQFNVSDAVVDNWVETVLSIDSSADSHLGVWEILCAIDVFTAEGWTVAVVAKLVPN